MRLAAHCIPRSRPAASLLGSYVRKRRQQSRPGLLPGHGASGCNASLTPFESFEPSGGDRLGYVVVVHAVSRARRGTQQRPAAAQAVRPA